MSPDSFNFKYKANKITSKTKQGLFGLVARFFKIFSLKKGAPIHGSHQVNLDQKLVYSLSKSRIPTLKQFKYLNKYLNRRERWVMRSCLSVILISVIFLGARFYFNHLQTIPVVGGDYTEGVVGYPKYINPLYSSVSDVDSDLSQLIYSSLFKRDVNGFLAKDLIDSYEVSDNGKTYSIKIRPGVHFSNGKQLTADDVVFTFNAIKDPQYNSPLRSSFSGVSIEKVDDQTVRFNLNAPYAAFFELLTFGILPQELWYQVPPASASLADLNLKPVGSGPYMIKSYTKDKSGNLKSYNFVINENYYSEKGKIKNLIFKFYSSFEELIAALSDSSVDGISYLPVQFKGQAANKTYLNYYKLNLPQLNSVFFNPKVNTALADKKVRQALALAINKEELLEKTLSGDGRIIDGPILPDSFAYNTGIKKYEFDQAGSKKLLESAGWKPFAITDEQVVKASADVNSEDEKTKEEAQLILNMGKGSWYNKDGKFLIIKLTTIDSGENPLVVEAIKNYWQQIGVKTDVELVSPSQIQADVIKPRAFQALFYGEMVGADPDPYLFWHSSQIGENGLNIAGYANKAADKLLEDARLTVNLDQRKEAYKKFQDTLVEDEPAIFLYSPVYTYVQDKKVKNFNTKSIIVPSDRLADITSWHISTGKKIVW